MQVQLYYTLRSPYCYLATPRLAALEEAFNLTFEIKHLHPHFVRDPEGIYTDSRPMRGTYAARDVRRVAERLGMPMRRPRPDPVVQDRYAGAFAKEQPDLHLLTRVIHLAVLAAEEGRGMPFLIEVSRLMWSGETIGWHEDDKLGPALTRAGLDVEELTRKASAEHDRLEAQLAQNAKDQLAAGHWGTPLMVFEGEPFFGQDRIDDLVWRMKSKMDSERIDESHC